MNDLHNVKVGDKLLVRYQSGERIEVVTRTTKTQICTEQHKYSKSNGNQFGQYLWFRPYAKIATDEDIARIEAKQKRDMLLNKFSGISPAALTNEQLESIIEIAKTTQK